MKKTVILLFLLAFLLPLTAFAKDARVAQAESWLNNLRTGEARFTQWGSDGTVLTGDFFIQRPGKLRFQYDPPVSDLVVADGFLIHFYDAQQKHTSSAPIGQTLADFFLRPNASLSGDLQVTNVRTRKGIVSMAVTQKADPGSGQLVLNFTEKPFALQGWEIIDAQGLSTRIALSNLRTGMELPPQFFIFKDPSGRGRMNQ